MQTKTEEKLVELINELQVSNKLIAANLKDHNDAHNVANTQLIEIAAGVITIKEKLFYLLAITIIALSLLAGAEKILSIL